MQDLTLGYRATGTLLQTGGTNGIAGDLTVGDEGYCYGTNPREPGIGRYELSGAGQLSVGGEEVIGYDRGFQLGQGCSKSRGDFIQSGGTHTAPTVCIGDNVQGEYLQSGGVYTVQTFLYLGYQPSGIGTYEISDGELSAFKAWVGYEGVGEFTQTGGVVTFDDLDVGRLGGASGTCELSGAGVLTVEDRVTVGRTGDGVLILGGGTLMAEDLIVGRYSGLGQLGISDPSADVTVGMELTLGGNAFFTAEPGSVIHMTHDAAGTSAASFDNLSSSPGNLSGLANLELSFEGGAGLTSSMEVGGTDLGAVESGFVGNYSLGMLRAGTSATPADVMLVDLNDNGGPIGEPEALYVDRIVLSAASTLDLNGVHVYYHSLCNEGGTIELNGGALERVGVSCDLNCDGDVDLDDYSIFASCLTGPNGPLPPGCDAADFDGDSDCDLADYAILQADFTGPNP